MAEKPEPEYMDPNFLSRLSHKTGLSESTCKELLASQWTLSDKIGEPTVWVASMEAMNSRPIPPEDSGIQVELTALLNRYSAESVSGTPDFILSTFLMETLKNFNEAISRRASWRGELVDFDPRLSK